MNVLFIAASELVGNSALHTLSVARVMQSRGIECAVSCRGDDNNVRPRGGWPFLLCDQRELMHNGVLFPNGRGPDLIHAWTPREHVRRITERMVERYKCPYIVHLEDNEEVILADTLGTFSYSQLAQLPARITDQVIAPHLSHPRRYRWFLEGASGVTALIDKLMEFKPESTPGTVFWPGFEEAILTAHATRRDFGLEEEAALLVYNGNIHLSNAEDVGSLIDAVGLLRRRGVPVMLVKTGANHALRNKLKEAQNAGYLIDLGFLSRSEIHSLLNLADVLVQPGHKSAFNDYRFPCKLPEFLATGKPVVLPNTNLGRYLSHGENCLLMDTGDAVEIADKVQLLLQERRLSDRIGRAGRKFATQRLNWERNLEPVLELYQHVLEAPLRKGNIAREDPLPVELKKITAEPDDDQPYLALAVKSIALGTGRVVQRANADLFLYEKWLAAQVQHAFSSAAPTVTIEGWRDQAEWKAATTRGYAVGVAGYLRQAGLPITNIAIQEAFKEQEQPEPRQPKTTNWVSDADLQRTVSLYSGNYPAPGISYAMVSDYCDGVNKMRCLATTHGDLKEVKQPWVVKAILGVVPLGSRILEIGAGEPWISDILSRAGYEVWIVDPYNGSSNGSVAMAEFMRECPNVHFLRDIFTDQILDLPPSSFDCIYSVSVLEHLEYEGLLAIARGHVKFLKPQGVSIHAIDLIHRGIGHQEDMGRLKLLARLFDIDDLELHTTLQRLDRDLDTYPPSAEGFNQRQYSQPLEKFCWRKNVSLQLVTSAERVARSLPAADRP